MKYSDESYNLRIELDTKECELSSIEIEKMEESLRSLRQLVASFPISNLYITVIHHPRSREYHVKTALALSGEKLFTGDRDNAVQAAFERCVGKLVQKVAAYKARLRHDSVKKKQQAGTDQALISAGDLDIDRMDRAVANNDYPDFADALDVFTGPLTDRIGRWIERYPTLQSRLGTDITISDVVEEVFLTAFEQFPDRPREVPAGDWLEKMIDPAVHALIDASQEELSNISYLKSLREHMLEK